MADLTQAAYHGSGPNSAMRRIQSGVAATFYKGQFVFGLAGGAVTNVVTSATGVLGIATSNQTAAIGDLVEFDEAEFTFNPVTADLSGAIGSPAIAVTNNPADIVAGPSGGVSALSVGLVTDAAAAWAKVDMTKRGAAVAGTGA